MADITAPHTPESKRPRKQRPESVKAEQAFLTLLDAENVTLLEDGYLGGKTPHRVRCARGHLTTPRPGNVIRRQSVCGTCRALAARRQRSDAVAAEATFRAAVEAQGAQLISPYRGRKKRHEDDFDVVKFGITSGDPRPRLSVHARDGFDRVVRLLEGLPGDTAPVLERTILAALRDAREKPARGREYFPTRVLPLVLDLVDNHPALR